MGIIAINGDLDLDQTLTKIRPYRAVEHVRAQRINVVQVANEVIQTVLGDARNPKRRIGRDHFGSPFQQSCRPLDRRDRFAVDLDVEDGPLANLDPDLVAREQLAELGTVDQVNRGRPVAARLRFRVGREIRGRDE